MDEDAPHQMRWPRVCARVAGYTLLAVGLYVLSVGPSSYLFLFGRSETLDGLHRRLYAPIYWLAGETDFMDPVMRYDAWWWALPGGPADRIMDISPAVPTSGLDSPAEPVP